MKRREQGFLRPILGERPPGKKSFPQKILMLFTLNLHPYATPPPKKVLQPPPPPPPPSPKKGETLQETLESEEQRTEVRVCWSISNVCVTNKYTSSRKVLSHWIILKPSLARNVCNRDNINIYVNILKLKWTRVCIFLVENIWKWNRYIFLTVKLSGNHFGGHWIV